MAEEGGNAGGGWVRSEPRSILASLPAGPGRTLRSEAHLLADINPPTASLSLVLPPSLSPLLHLFSPPFNPSFTTSWPANSASSSIATLPPHPFPPPPPLSSPRSICIRLSGGKGFLVEGFFFTLRRRAGRVSVAVYSSGVVALVDGCRAAVFFSDVLIMRLFVVWPNHQVDFGTCNSW